MTETTNNTTNTTGVATTGAGSGSSVTCMGDGVYNITKNGSITCS
jgi:hypothetical protein